MTGAIDQTIELNEAAKKLNAPKRRIYDVTNVLEGLIHLKFDPFKIWSIQNLIHVKFDPF